MTRLLAGRPVVLTAAEYAVLFELSTNVGLVLPRDQLLQRVWGEANSGESGSVRTTVKRLRQKLEDDARSPLYIFTQPRIGYRMKNRKTAEQGQALLLPSTAQPRRAPPHSSQFSHSSLLTVPPLSSLLSPRRSPLSSLLAVPPHSSLLAVPPFRRSASLPNLGITGNSWQ